jgi:hypothetical protein
MTPSAPGPLYDLPGKRRAVVVIVALLVMSAVSMGIAVLTRAPVRIGGMPISQQTGPATIQPYQPPPDGSGYSTLPDDQPTPGPGLESSDPCTWLNQTLPALQRTLGATHIVPNTDACHVLLGAGRDDIQVGLDEPYTENLDPVRFMHPATVDGLQAREFAEDSQGNGECQIDVNDRAAFALDVNAWNVDKALDTNGDTRTRCREAEQTADILVRQFVPLAGGTPYPGFPQQPTEALLNGAKVCDVITNGDVFYADYLDDRHPSTGTTALGATCTYTTDQGTVTALLTSQPMVLNRFPVQDTAAVVRPDKIGVLPAVTQQTAHGCTEAIHLGSGQILALTYRPTQQFAPSACYAMRAVAAHALGEMLNLSSY